MSKKHLRWSISVLALTALLLSGCAGQTPPETTAPTAAPTTAPATAPAAVTTSPDTEPPASVTEPTQEMSKIEIDNLEKNARDRISFAAGDSPEEALRFYAETAYPAFLDSLSPESLWRPSEYIPVRQTVLDTLGNAFKAEFSYAVPQEEYYFYIRWEDGEGALEGYKIITEQIALERHADGLWYQCSPEDLYVVKGEGEWPEQPFRENAPDAAAGREYLARAAEEFAQAQAGEDDAAKLRALAEVFVRCVAAAAHSNSQDFDWTLLCTQEATELLGMRSIKQQYLSGYRGADVIRSDWEEELRYDVVSVWEDTAMVKLNNNHIHLYFVKTEGVWRISDVVRPWTV